MADNPWRKLGKGSSGRLNSIRISEKNRFHFFWAKNDNESCMLLLALKSSPADLPPLPRLKGINIHWSQHALQLQMILSSESNWELFLTLCNDVIARTNTCVSEQEALLALLARLTTWQRFLSQSPVSSLSEREVQGLFGELTFLRNELMSRFPPEVAVASWHGPEGTPQDFAIGTTLFEVKTHLAESSRAVLISSPEQLWPSDSRKLFLTVIPLARSLKGGTSLLDLVRQIAADLEGTAALSVFEDRLARVGYIDLDEYALPRYIAQDVEYYSVLPGFPLNPKRCNTSRSR